MPSSRVRTATTTGSPQPVTAMVILLPLAVVLAVVPYVAPLFGFGLQLDPMLEVVDHVVPAVVIVVAVVAALLLRRHRAAGSVFAVASGLAFVAGLWTTSTHVPLLIHAQQGLVGWGTALFHSTPGPVILGVALTALVPSLRAVD